MLVIYEALFVGFYCLALYTIITFIPHRLSEYTVWFIMGFIKHFVAYLIGIHDYYCKYGQACHASHASNVSHTNINQNYNQYIIIDSIFEGLLFIVIAYVWISWFKNK